MKQTAVEWYNEQLNLYGDMAFNKEITLGQYHIKKQELFQQAKEMEKQQIKDAFVECWKSNVPDGIECKLDSEEYYKETFKK